MFKPTNKEVCAIYFSQTEEPNEYICKCGTKRKKAGSSYQNLMQHILKDHKDYLEIMKTQRTILSFVDSKSQNVWTWLKFIILKGLPFVWCDDKDVRDFSKAKSITVKTFKKYMCSLTKIVEMEISKLLPEKFGLMIDGWSDGPRHFFAIFACTYKQESFLLSFSPPIEAGDLSALSLQGLISFALSIYGKTLQNVSFFVGDNCSVNRKLSRDTGNSCIFQNIEIPLVGCASHRLNLAVKEYLEPYEPQLSKVDNLMKKLKTIKYAALLEKKTELRPVSRNVTRWSSTYNMLKRYFEIKDYLPSEIPEIADLIPSHRETLNLQVYYSKLS